MFYICVWIIDLVTFHKLFLNFQEKAYDRSKDLPAQLSIINQTGGRKLKKIDFLFFSFIIFVGICSRVYTGMLWHVEWSWINASESESESNSWD